MLFFNSYFNHSSGVALNEGADRWEESFYLAGPDPYYNMRLAQIMGETGKYMGGQVDPLLNYPIGRVSERPPLFVTTTVASAHGLSFITGTDFWDALRMCMLFIPAICGALLIFPVYYMGKVVFNYKVGIFAALLVAITPIHMTAGHGSSYSLFDHDSFLLLLFAITFALLLKMYKEKNARRGYFYAALAGVAYGAIQLSWTAAYGICWMMITFVGFIFILDIWKNKYKNDLFYKKMLSFSAVGVIISYPWYMEIGKMFSYPLFIFIIIIFIYILYRVLAKYWRLWIISIPTIIISGIIGIMLLGVFFEYLPEGALKDAVGILAMGKGIYTNKVSMTIAEAGGVNFSYLGMAFGPSGFVMALLGSFYFIWRMIKQKFQTYQLFFIYIFFFYIWMLIASARFINDLVPTVCLLNGFVIYEIVSRLHFERMFPTFKFKERTINVHWYHITALEGTIMVLIAPWILPTPNFLFNNTYFFIQLVAMLTWIKVFEESKWIQKLLRS